MRPAQRPHFGEHQGGSLTDLKALEEPILIEDGYFTPPVAKIGHGIAFDRAYLKAHEVR